MGLTGGIASGKSTLTTLLAARLQAEVFDSDKYVHGLLEGSEETIDAIAGKFGRDILRATGQIDRARLGAMVFSDPAKRRGLEAIIHPRVRAAWTELALSNRSVPGWLIIDIPLLFETEADLELPAVLLVGSSRETQMRRLTQIRGIKPDRARRMIEAQMDMAPKIVRTTHLIWNDGDLPSLHRQAELCARLLTSP